MLNFNSALTSKIISLIIAVSFILADISYAGVYQQGSLRVPMGRESTYERMDKVSGRKKTQMFTAAPAPASSGTPETGTGFVLDQQSGLYVPDRTIVTAGKDASMLAGLQREKIRLIKLVSNAKHFIYELGYSDQEQALSRLSGELAMIPLDGVTLNLDLESLVDILSYTSGLNPAKTALRLYIHKLILIELKSYRLLTEKQIARILEYLKDNAPYYIQQEKEFYNYIISLILKDEETTPVTSIVPGSLWRMDDAVFMKLVGAVSAKPFEYRKQGLAYLPDTMCFGIEIEIAAVGSNSSRDAYQTTLLNEGLKKAFRQAGSQFTGWLVKVDEDGNLELSSKDILENKPEYWAKLEIDLELIRRTVLRVAEKLEIANISQGMHIHASMPGSSSFPAVKAITFIGKAYEGLWDVLSFTGNLSTVSFDEEALFTDAHTQKNATFIYDAKEKGLAHNSLRHHKFESDTYAASIQAAIEVFLNTVHQAITRPELFNVFASGIPLLRGIEDPALERRLIRQAIDNLSVSEEAKRTFIKLLAEGGFFRSNKPTDLSKSYIPRLKALYEEHSLGYLFDIHLNNNGWRNGNTDAADIIQEALENINDIDTRIEVVNAIFEAFFNLIDQNPGFLVKISQLKGIEDIKDKICGFRQSNLLEGHTDRVFGATLIDPNTIMSWSEDNTIRLWNRNTGKSIRTLEGHTDWVNGAILIDPNTIMSWSDDNTIRLWNRNTGKCIRILESHTALINGAILIDPNTIMSWSNDNTILLWDRNTGKSTRTLEGHKYQVYGAILIDTNTIMSWSNDNTILLWDRNTGKSIRTLEGHTDWVNGAILIDPNTIMSWSGDNTIRLWNRNTGKSIHILKGHKYQVYGAILIDPNTIVSWSEDETIQLRRKYSLVEMIANSANRISSTAAPAPELTVPMQPLRMSGRAAGSSI